MLLWPSRPVTFTDVISTVGAVLSILVTICGPSGNDCNGSVQTMSSVTQLPTESDMSTVDQKPTKPSGRGAATGSKYVTSGGSNVGSNGTDDSVDTLVP